MKNVANIPRTRGSETLLFKIGDQEIIFKNEDFFQRWNVRGVIRLPSFEYGLIKNHYLTNRPLTHFNLQRCGNKKGSRYALVRIIKSGYFDGEKEKQPLLDLEDFFIAECFSVRDNISYDQITKADFQNSFEHIKTVSELKNAILSRYRQSLPHLSEEELLSLGVSQTKLRIIKYLKIMRSER